MTLAEAIDSYSFPPQHRPVLDGVDFLILFGIAGAGKDTILRKLVNDRSGYYIVSHTTRRPRENDGVMEEDGVDYHFISHEQALRMILDEQFVEAKYVHGNVYGTSITEFESAKSQAKHAMTDIDIQGVHEYLSIKPDTRVVFLLPPSAKEWERRLRGRYSGLINKDDMVSRLKSARREIKQALQDNRFVIIVNDDLEETLRRVHDVIDGSILRSSDYAQDIADDLLGYIDEQIGTLE